MVLKIKLSSATLWVKQNKANKLNWADKHFILILFIKVQCLIALVDTRRWSRKYSINKHSHNYATDTYLLMVSQQT